MSLIKDEITALSVISDSYYSDNDFNRDVAEIFDGKGEETIGKKVIRKLSRFQPRIVTTNYDKSIESVLKDFKGYNSIFDAEYDDDFEKYRYILHIHGCIDEPETMIITRRQYHNLYVRNQGVVRNVFTKIFENDDLTILFIGYGLSEPEILNIIMCQRNDQRRFYALEGFFSHNKELKRGMSEYYRGMGIELLPFEIDDRGFNALSDVLDSWNNALSMRISQRTSSNIRTIDNCLTKMPDEKSIGLIRVLFNKDDVYKDYFVRKLSDSDHYERWIDALIKADSSDILHLPNILGDSNMRMVIITSLLNHARSNNDMTLLGRVKTCLCEYVDLMNIDMNYSLDIFPIFILSADPENTLSNSFLNSIVPKVNIHVLLEPLYRFSELFLSGTPESQTYVLTILFKSLTEDSIHGRYRLSKFNEVIMSELVREVYIPITDVLVSHVKSNPGEYLTLSSIATLISKNNKNIHEYSLLWLFKSLSLSEIEAVSKFIDEYLQSKNHALSTISLHMISQKYHWLKNKLDDIDLGSLNYTELLNLLDSNVTQMGEPEKKEWIYRIEGTVFNPNTEVNDRYRMDLVSVLNPDLEYRLPESTDCDGLLGPSGLLSIENRGRQLRYTNVVNDGEYIIAFQSFDDIRLRMKEIGSSPTMFELSAYNSSVRAYITKHPEDVWTNLDFITSLDIPYIDPYLKLLETDTKNPEAFIKIVDNALNGCSYEEPALLTLISSINRWSENNTDPSNRIIMILKECIQNNIESFISDYSKKNSDPIADLIGNGFLLMMESLICGHYDESIRSEISSFVTSSIDRILDEGNSESVMMMRLFISYKWSALGYLDADWILAKMTTVFSGSSEVEITAIHIFGMHHVDWEPIRYLNKEGNFRLLMSTDLEILQIDSIKTKTMDLMTMATIFEEEDCTPTIMDNVDNHVHTMLKRICREHNNRYLNPENVDKLLNELSKSITSDCRADFSVFKLIEMINDGVFEQSSWTLLKSAVKCQMEYVDEELVSFLKDHLSSNWEDVLNIIGSIVENTSVNNIASSFKDLLTIIKKDIDIDVFDHYVETLVKKGFYSYRDLLDNC